MNALPRYRRPLAAILAAVFLTLTLGGSAVAAAPDAASVDTAMEELEGPQFYSGLAIDVSGTIDGDVYASGQSIVISGDVTGDVIAAAQTITVTGKVDGDVRLAAQDVSVTGEVSRSGTVFASTLTVGDTGSFGDDVVAAAGRVDIAGEVGRDLMLSAGSLRIDGRVGGNVTYVSDDEADIAPDAVGGEVQRVEPPQTPRVQVSPWAVFFAWILGVLYSLVALSLIMLLAGLVFPRWLHRVTNHLTPSPWKALLVGFVASVAVPIGLFLLAVSIIGAPLALAGAVVWIVMMMATFVYSAYYLGRLVFRDRVSPVVMSLVGGLILIVALQIPWVNILVWLAMLFFGLGAQLLEVQRQRPWHRAAVDTTPQLPSEPSSVSSTPPAP